jgi:hypothetical protein
VSPICANGAAGAGFCNAWVSSLAAIIAVSMDDIWGIVMSEGRDLKELAIRSWPVLEHKTV